MAFMSQESKKGKEGRIKELLRQYGLEGSLSVRDHSTLCLTVREGVLDFIGNYNGVGKESYRGREQDWYPLTKYIDVNHFYLPTFFGGQCLAFLEDVLAVMDEGNFDQSDSQTDYFNVGWYIHIAIGQWDKPYLLKKQSERFCVTV